MIKISIIGLVVGIIVLYLLQKPIRKVMEANSELRRKVDKALSVVFVSITVICFVLGPYIILQALFFTKSPLPLVKIIIGLPGVFIILLGIVSIFLEKKRRKEVKLKQESI